MTLSQDNDPIISEEQELKAAIASDRRWFGMGVGVFVLVLGVVGGIGYYATLNNQAPSINIQTKKTEISTEIPKESQKPEVENFTVEILNGSGVTGAAKAAEAALNTKFQAPNSNLVITTGNAAAQTGTTVKYQSEQLRRSSIVGVITELYPDAKVSVDTSLEHSVEIIIGK